MKCQLKCKSNLIVCQRRLLSLAAVPKSVKHKKTGSSNLWGLEYSRIFNNLKAFLTIRLKKNSIISDECGIKRCFRTTKNVHLLVQRAQAEYYICWSQLWLYYSGVDLPYCCTLQNQSCRILYRFANVKICLDLHFSWGLIYSPVSNL